jgi:hypothetical protein
MIIRVQIEEGDSGKLLAKSENIMTQMYSGCVVTSDVFY